MTARDEDEREVAGGAHGGVAIGVPVRTETGDGAWPISGAAIGLPPIDPARYQLVEEFARGGLGRIMKVRDLRIGRVVAIKEMLRRGEVPHARFLREATITARLEHPAIVPVHEIGRWPSGDPFYSMKLIAGRSLHDVISDAPDLDGRLALLPNVIAVADAIAYAHTQGIIHRDLKPANILVGAFGETVVIDWGLAKNLRVADKAAPEVEMPDEAVEVADGDRIGSLTVAGAVLGTPCYMPPEQADGRPVDERADVYALGAMLYEVLAGEPPYHGPAALFAVRSGPPPPVEARQPGVPPDLAAVVRKAMARAASDRYPTARELVLDLRRFQTGRLVNAHVYSSGMLIQRWLRRYRAPVVVAAVALLILAGVSAVSVDRVISERDVASRRSEQLVLAQVRSLVERDATQALAWLRSYPEDGAERAEVRALAIEAEGRGVARHVVDGVVAFTADGLGWIAAPDGAFIELHEAASGALVRRWPHPGRVTDSAAIPGGHAVAVLDDGDAAVVLLDLETGRSRRLPAHPSRVSVLAVSPDGRWLASGGSDGLVRLARVDRDDSRPLRGFAHEPLLMTFSGDSRWLLGMDVDRTVVRLWPVDGGDARQLAPPRGVVHAAVSREGAFVAFGHADGTVSLWSSATASQVKTLVRPTMSAATRVVFSPDGQWVASGGDDRRVVLTWLETGGHRILTGHRSAVADLAFSPDSTLIASGTNGGEVRLWQVKGSAERMLGRHPGQSSHLAFSADGHRLVTGTRTRSERGETRIWDVTTEQQRGLRCLWTTSFHGTFSPDSRRIAATGDDNSVSLWDLAGGRCRRLEGHETSPVSLAFAPDGERLASVTPGTIRLWDLAPCRSSLAGCEPVPRILADHLDGESLAAFSPDGRWLASSDREGTLRLWDLVSGRPRVLQSHARVVWTLAFSPDGARLASAGGGHDVWLWNIASGVGVPLRGHTDGVSEAMFSGDGRSLWTHGADHTVREWQLDAGTSRVVKQAFGDAATCALAPRERWIACAYSEGRVAVMDRATLTERALADHAATVRELAFSPDGTLLATAGTDQVVRVWDVERGRLEAVVPIEFTTPAIAFSPDGAWIAVAGDGPVIRVWPVRPSAAVPDDLRELATWMANLSTATPDLRERTR